MVYLQLASENACKAVSRALYRVCRAEHTANTSSDTLYLFAWLKHPSRDEWALQVDPTVVVRRDPEARRALLDSGDAFGSRQMLAQTFAGIARNGMASINSLRQLIVDSGEVRMADVLSYINPALVRTRAQMDADGWFPAIISP